MKGLLLKEQLWKATVLGKKTETRRVGSLKTFPRNEKLIPTLLHKTHSGDLIPRSHPNTKGIVFDTDGNEYKPRMFVNDIVYLKEPYAVIDEITYYQFDFEKDKRDFIKWKNKLFMPESLARKKIIITDVWAERLVDITPEAVLREGIWTKNESELVNHYFEVFENINGGEMKIKAPVWVYQYKNVYP